MRTSNPSGRSALDFICRDLSLLKIKGNLSRSPPSLSSSLSLSLSHTHTHTCTHAHTEARLLLGWKQRSDLLKLLPWGAAAPVLRGQPLRGADLFRPAAAAGMLRGEENYPRSASSLTSPLLFPESSRFHCAHYGRLIPPDYSTGQRAPSDLISIF